MLTTTTATLDKNTTHYQLNAITGFTQLQITAAVNSLMAETQLPVIEVKLQNDTELFTLLLQQVPGAAQYNTHNLLAVAKQLPALQQTLFNRLQLTLMQPETLQQDQVITVQLQLAE